MTKTLKHTGPTKISTGDLTFFEVRVLGVFIGAFSSAEQALGAEAEAIMDMLVEEIFENNSQNAQMVDKFFRATCNGKVRYAALTSEGHWTDVFDSVDELIASLSAFRPGI